MTINPICWGAETQILLIYQCFGIALFGKGLLLPITLSLNLIYTQTIVKRIMKLSPNV